MGTTVGILGAGRWGTTLAALAAGRGHDVLVWGEAAAVPVRAGRRKAKAEAQAVPDAELPAGVRRANDLAEVTQACELLIVAVSVGRLRPLLRELGGLVDGSHVVVHAVRGIEADSFALPSRVVAEETCVRKVGALLGAALVDELRAGRPNAAVVASRFPEVVQATQAALGGETLRIQGSADLVGVETAAAAASAVSLGLGLALERGFGPAALAAAVTRCAGEVARLCQAQGGQADTAYGVAGLGYLLVERESNSRDVQAGRQLARGRTAAEVLAALGPVDAVQAARAFAELAERQRVAAPLTQALAAVLDGRAEVAAALAALTS